MRRAPFLAAFVLLLLARALPGAEWIVPGVARAPGANGTHFVSDLTIANLGGDGAALSIRFVPSGGGAAPASRTIGILPGETLSYRDPLGVLFGIASGGGALVVASDADLAIRATTFNDAPDGTFGLALPAVESSRLLRAGERAASYWVAQSADFARGYRTNVGVVFPESGGGAATLTHYDARGAIVATRAVAASSPSFFQEPLTAYSSLEIAAGSIAIEVTRGAAAGYTAVVDNATGDGSLFPLDRIPTGATDVVLAGVARAPGANATEFRTDVRIANPGPEPASVEVRLLRPGLDNREAAPRTIALAAREVAEVVDILASLFGEPVGSTGALRFTSNAPLVVLGRTSNVGAGRGTYGSQQFGVPYDGFLAAGGGSLTLPAIRQNDAYRTNIGFTSGASGARGTASLLSARGAPIAETTVTLPPYSWSQTSVAALFPDVAIPDDSRIAIAPAAGSIDVYSSTVDQRSGDAVVSAGVARRASAGRFGPGSGGRGGPAPGLQRFPGVSGREYSVYVPTSYRDSEPARLVIALGGQGMSGELTLAVGWRAIADEENLIVATLTPSSSGPGYSGAYDVLEFETIAKAEREVLEMYNVAIHHIYLWGFSAGAHVSYMMGLAAERSNRLAAMAIQAGAIEAAATRVEPPSWPPQPGARRLPVYISCGTLDTMGSGGGLIGALRRNRAMLAAEGYPVATREVEGQGHTYTVRDVEEAWAFLEAQALRR